MKKYLLICVLLNCALATTAQSEMKDKKTNIVVDANGLVKLKYLPNDNLRIHKLDINNITKSIDGIDKITKEIRAEIAKQIAIADSNFKDHSTDFYAFYDWLLGSVEIQNMINDLKQLAKAADAPANMLNGLLDTKLKRLDFDKPNEKFTITNQKPKPYESEFIMYKNVVQNTSFANAVDLGILNGYFTSSTKEKIESNRELIGVCIAELYELQKRVTDFYNKPIVMTGLKKEVASKPYKYAEAKEAFGTNSDFKNWDKEYNNLKEEFDNIKKQYDSIKRAFQQGDYTSYLWLASQKVLNPFVKLTVAPKPMQAERIAYIKNALSDPQIHRHVSLSDFDKLLAEVKKFNPLVAATPSQLSIFASGNKVVNTIAYIRTINTRDKVFGICNGYFKEKRYMPWKINVVHLDYNQNYEYNKVRSLKRLERTTQDGMAKYIIVHNVPAGMTLNLNTTITEAKEDGLLVEGINTLKSVVTSAQDANAIEAVSKLNLNQIIKGEVYSIEKIVNTKNYMSEAEPSVYDSTRVEISQFKDVDENQTTVKTKTIKTVTYKNTKANIQIDLSQDELLKSIAKELIYLSYFDLYISNDLSEIKNLGKAKESEQAPYHSVVLTSDAQQESKMVNLLIKKAKDEEGVPNEDTSKMNDEGKKKYIKDLKAKEKQYAKPYLTTSYRVSKRELLAFSMGVAYVKNSPVVYTVETNSKAVTSINASQVQFKFKTGLHLYPWKFFKADESFLGISSLSMRNRISVYGGLEINKDPLSNLYLGIGYDIIPGIKLTAGSNWVKTFTYDIQNNNLIDKTTEFVPKGFIGIDISPVATAQTFLALFALTK